jgi:isoleucyl-tRNA synthetase
MEQFDCGKRLSSARIKELVPESVNFPSRELAVLTLWAQLRAFERSNEVATGRPLYTFYDGPPFATGLPHYGHLLAGTIKDTITRYAYQTGHQVPRRFGWDCHGLPVEYEIDQKLNIRSREDVLKIGIANYNEECRKIVLRYSSEWEKIVTRMGRWIDFQNGYRTMDKAYMESVWWVFGMLYQKGLIYRGFRVMPFSTACRTPLSNFETNLNYRDVQDPAITVSFPLKNDPDNASFLAWTTTPWTIPSNVALCVNSNMEYVRVRDLTRENRVWILAEARLGSIFKLSGSQKAPERKEFIVIGRHRGSELVGLHYTPVFPYFSDEQYTVFLKDPFRVIADDFVTADSGTGIVHLAPAFGEDDYRVCLAAGIIGGAGTCQDRPIWLPCPVDENGSFTDPVHDFVGVYIKDADRGLIRKMKTLGRLVKQETYMHSYPFCWRSDTPLIYRAVPSWFVAVEQIRDLLIECNQKTYWVPSAIKEHRFANWLANTRDWNISRNRYWGTPLPVWTDDAGEEIVVIASVAELEKHAGLPAGSIQDLHRHHVDSIEIPSKLHPERMLHRVEEVFDCWFESGAMPYASVHYPFEQTECAFRDGMFPAQFIAEGLDQTRGWFYTLMVLGAALFGEPPFKNVVVNGLVLAEDGKKMSKRLKNYPDPMNIVDSFGADALRLYLINSPVVRGEPLRFRESGVKDIVRDVMLPWYNAFRFFVQNFGAFIESDAEVEQLLDRAKHTSIRSNPMDRWMSSLLASLIQFFHREMKAYRLYTVVPRLLSFIESLTNWYVRLNRPRLKGSAGDTTLDQAIALYTLGDVLCKLSILMAPFAPFMAEWTYQTLRTLPLLRGFDHGAESVHFMMLPTACETASDVRFEDAVHNMQLAILLGRAVRERRNVPLKQPLRRVIVIHRDETVLQDVSDLEKYVQSELNVKQVEYSTDEDCYISRRAVPDGKVLGRKLGPDFKEASAEIRGWTPVQVAEFERKGTASVCQGRFEVSVEEVFINRDVNRDSLLAEEDVECDAISGMLVMLDMRMDDDLYLDGVAREVVNRVQKLRKKVGLVPTDRVDVFVQGGNIVERVLKNRADQVGALLGCKRVLAADDLSILRAHVAPQLPLIIDNPAESISGEQIRITLVRSGAWLLPNMFPDQTAERLQALQSYLLGSKRFSMWPSAASKSLDLVIDGQRVTLLENHHFSSYAVDCLESIRKLEVSSAAR